MTSTQKAFKIEAATGRLQRECPLCGSALLDYEFIVDNCPMCCCRGCSLMFLNPQPESVRESQDDNPEQDPLNVYHVQETNAATRIRSFASYVGGIKGRLLIIGADKFLKNEAALAGFDVTAWSLSDFEENRRAKAVGQVFDGCILFCSLERSSDPSANLAALQAMLVPGGALMVLTPTVDSRTARMFGSSWWEFNRYNRYYFTVDTLQSLLIRNGFTDPVVLHDHSVVSLQHMKQKLALSPLKLRYKLLGLLISMSPKSVRNRTFRFLHSRMIVIVRSRISKRAPKVSVIVPVYNESATFPVLIKALLEKRIDGVEIETILVESNSTDGSRELVRNYEKHPGVRVILEDRPAGKGHAVRTGLAAASGDVLLIQDADLEYDLEDYSSLLQPILDHRCNFVIGSRHAHNTRIWKIRQFNDAAGLAAIFNFGHIVFLTLFNLFYQQRLSDPFSMFKVFRRDCLYGLTFECDRFDFDFELVIKLLRKGYRVLEVPVNYRARSFTEGKKVTVFRDPLTWLRALVKYRNSPLYPKGISAD